MENIRQAVERAKASQGDGRAQASAKTDLRAQHPQLAFGPAPAAILEPDVELSRAHLEAKRIIAFDKSDARARSFDMLRAQVLQEMDLKDWKVLGVTSPTPACGKTLTAVNLAISIARLPERSAVLIDLDLQKPQVARCLGLEPQNGMLSLLHGRSTLANSVAQVGIGNLSISVLPTEGPTSGSSELIASRQMSALFQEIRKNFPSATVIVDLPPALVGDDVITVLPQIDCALLVAAVGTSTVSEIKQCNTQLRSTEVLRLVLNKVQDAGAMYYYY